MFTDLFIDVFHGQLSAHSAHVYARVDGVTGGEEWSLRGRVRGPECRHARTLPATYPFADLGPGANLLARATLPDPCFWSPDLPALYRVSVELLRHGALVQSVERDLGLRFLGSRASSFYLESKRWVLRAVHHETNPETPLAAWREVGAAMVIEQPGDELCREAAREGVLLVARAGRFDRAEFQRLSQWASVGLVMIEGQPERLADARRFLPNTLLVQHDASQPAMTGIEPNTAWIETVSAARLEQVGRRARLRPTIGLRRLTGIHSLADARSACDLLQADLAPFGDCAGYVV